MLKKLSKVLIALGLVFMLLLSGSTALAEVVDSGSCGEEAEWRLNSEGVLLIYGSGDMEDNSQYANASMLQPWRSRQTEVKRIVIGPDITSIAPYAFMDCVNATSVTFYSENLISIGSCAFQNCISLTDIAIPYGVVSIGGGVVAGCSSLTSMTIPNSVISIGAHAFFGCSGLDSITIPEGVTSIEYGTFSGCSSLNSIKIPNSVTAIGHDAFWAAAILKASRFRIASRLSDIMPFRDAAA